MTYSIFCMYILLKLKLQFVVNRYDLVTLHKLTELSEANTPILIFSNQLTSLYILLKQLILLTMI